VVRKVRAGHLTDGRHAPCIFPVPPCIPPRGNSRPPAPQNKVCRDRARAFLCSSPVTVLAFFPCRAQARASPAISAAPWAVRKCRSGLAGCHVACKQQCTGRAAGGVTARAFSAGGPPPLQSVTSFALFFCFRVRSTAGSRAWALPPIRSVDAAPQIKESARMVAALQSPGSRRSVAPHRLCAPPLPRYFPALPRGCNRPRGSTSRRPCVRFTPAPFRPPRGLPLSLRAIGRHALRGDCLGPPAFPFP